MKRVGEEDGSRLRDPERIPVSRQRLIEGDGKNMCFSKVGFYGCQLYCRNGLKVIENRGCGGSGREILLVWSRIRWGT